MKANSRLGALVFPLILMSASMGLAQSPYPVPWPPPVTNRAPEVRIVTPGDGSVFLAPLDLPICAFASGFTDMVVSVEFFAGTTSLGVATNSPIEPYGDGSWVPPRFDFCIVWTNPPPGAYSLTAIATDVGGNMVTSPPVDISVVTNLPPRVLITKPENGATILGPTNINICAAAFQPGGGYVTDVEFFEGTNSLGVVSNTITYVTNWGEVYPLPNTSYCLTWTDAPPGSYTLTAVATDNEGIMSTSAPVDISVVSHLPPHVRIVSPRNGARFTAPANLSILAVATDVDGILTNIEFFSGTNDLGAATSTITITNHGTVYDIARFAWKNVAAGTYTLTAVAMDDSGSSGTSAPVKIDVQAPPPPSVRLFTDGRVLLAPGNIWMASLTRNFLAPVASVQYFAGGNPLGVSTHMPFFTFEWTNVPPGNYLLTGVATDASGIMATSPPVDVLVTTNLPPFFPFDGKTRERR